jgi:EAL domain-containing protein (putative c-di-GMP-specific phosphodiesterase class I)
LGVKFIVNDFGTGCSSLSYLKRLPIDFLVSDRSFVEELGTDPKDEGIVFAVTILAHALGVQAIAKSVESAEQAERLWEMGCPLAQGSLYSRPLSPEAVGKLLEAGASDG